MRFTNNLLLFALLLFSSCNKWLEVDPKTQIASDANFSNEQGFKDALTGVYLTLSESSLYGKEMTFGFVDLLGRQYTQIASNDDVNYNAATHNYEHETFMITRDAVWTRSYFAIANLNNLLDALAKKDSTDFESYIYNCIKGEALTLRAFLHFDLLRLFAPAPQSKPTNTLAIPYRMHYTSNVEKQRTVEEVLTMALADLDEAIELLRTNDPLVGGSTVPSTTTGFLRNRTYKFNYYAALGVKARIHLYAGQMGAAREAALIVVNSGKFPTTALSAISGGNRILSTEVMCHLNINDVETLTSLFYSSSVKATKMDSEWNEWFDLNAGGSADYRYLYHTALSGTTRFPVKLNASVNTNAMAAKRIPLLRVSEMNYIIAESYLKTDLPTAINWLSKVRTSRNLSSLPNTLSENEFMEQLVKEYQKEFLCEGQLFYLYKRLNLANIPFYQPTMTDKMYVLPLPDDEILYGSIK